jgi:hypothetical protein
MFRDCITVKLGFGRRLRPKSIIDCDIALFIQLVVCPHFPREESEKSKKYLSENSFMLIKASNFSV